MLQYICYKYRIFYVSNVGLSYRIMGKTLYVDVGAATCRPRCIDYNLFGCTVPPDTRNNVAALTQRHPAPARGWHRGKYNLWG